MTLTTAKHQEILTFEQFIKNLPDEEGRYEFVNGEVVKILPIRLHEDIADFLVKQFDKEIDRRFLDYRVSGRFMIRTLNSKGREQGRHPDVTVVNKTLWQSDPFAHSALIEPPQLVVEVVSTNWEDDYIDKLDEYQRLGIPEYWIVDYLSLGSRDYLGNPKTPAVFIFLLDENGTYQINTYREGEQIISRTFPELNLLAEQILDL